MKKNKTSGSRKVSKRKLDLRLEHILMLRPIQLGRVAGGVSGDEFSCDEICSKPN